MEGVGASPPGPLNNSIPDNSPIFLKVYYSPEGDRDQHILYFLRFLEGQVELDGLLWYFFIIVQETQRLPWISPKSAFSDFQNLQTKYLFCFDWPFWFDFSAAYCTSRNNNLFHLQLDWNYCFSRSLKFQRAFCYVYFQYIRSTYKM